MNYDYMFKMHNTYVVMTLKKNVASMFFCANVYDVHILKLIQLLGILWAVNLLHYLPQIIVHKSSM